MADIKLQDALEEIYEQNPIEYRWKKYEKEAPKMDDDFKWNFLSEIKQPQLEIEGPSVGSLLYALNPQTSELGLKQMESELNQQLKANEMFDKRGEEALKFMENRVQEDIEKKKMQNVDAGHANSLIDNYIKAVQLGDDSAKAIAQDRLIRAFGSQANDILAKAEEQAKANAAQKSEVLKLRRELPGQAKFDNPDQRKAFIAKVESSNINEDDKSKLITEARQTEDWETINTNIAKQAQASAKAGRGVKKTEQQLINEKYKELKKKYPSMSDAEAYDRAKEMVGAK